MRFNNEQYVIHVKTGLTHCPILSCGFQIFSSLAEADSISITENAVNFIGDR